MLTQLALLALSGTALAASSYPEPTITLGCRSLLCLPLQRESGADTVVLAGPDPPSFTGPAPTGSWAPTGSVVASGTTYAPPSMTGTGKQAQINSAQDFCVSSEPPPKQDRAQVLMLPPWLHSSTSLPTQPLKIVRIVALDLGLCPACSPR